MTEIVSTLQHMYNQTMEMRDRRVDDWFLMGSPWPTAFFCFLYIYSVKYIGPRFMKGREPFEIRRVLLFYNVSMVIFSFYLFSEGIQVWGREYSLRCQPVDYSNNPKSLKIARACYWYYISKFVEFTDTIFFVLRKKFSQVSTLHVIHHGVMPMSVWFGVRFTPGGHSTFFGLLNTFVHIFMYTYYAIAALGPKYQKFLWWKRYMTAIQMLQFILVMVHSFQLLFVDCNYPRAFVWWIGGHAIMFLFLFADFYKSSYVRRSAANGALEPKAKLAINGKQNGHVPHLNGVVKSIANGTVSNGKATNGTTNGKATNGTTNGKATNGTTNGTTNGEAKKNGDIKKNGHVKHD